MAHFGLGGAAGGGPILRGGAAEDEELPEPEEDAEGEGEGRGDQGRMQAWMMLAQAAELRGDFAAAESWLARIDDPARALEVQTRLATLMARQGRVAEAREAVRRAPERESGDARAKLVAEASVLREVKRWADAYDVLGSAARRFTDDAEVRSLNAQYRHKDTPTNVLSFAALDAGLPPKGVPADYPWALGDVILALEADGKPLSIGGMGPLWLVFPPGVVPGDDRSSDAGLAWSVFHITLKNK